ncbi:MAG: 23S rRNA (adenine(2503)-C(2))-methyltransferase RlmN [Eggerthellaceae bacterium]|nr:23S rRNA (adenine(2503)-C(2))-methyltransferase RlmN [Eggerthellaceae bacterium]
MSAGIDTYNIQGLEELVAGLGQPRFRAMQLFEWLYGHGAVSYDQMTNLPAVLREELARVAPLQVPELVDKRISADGTHKYIMQLADGALVETVGIPNDTQDAAEGVGRLSVCVSSQVGCAMACRFCATGQEGFTRNLTPGEMAWQVLCVARDFDMRASNVVIMGQGEPFLNYDAVLSALRILNHPKGPGIGARHMTLSTCGITKGIERFSTEDEQFRLAVSLHSAQQNVRNELMPGCASAPLKALKNALLGYQAQTGRRVSFEYLLIDSVNDGADAQAALIAYCAGLKAHVNLLPINAVEGSSYKPATKARMHEWEQALAAAGVETSIRTSRGADIAGACGQLKNSRE